MHINWIGWALNGVLRRKDSWGEGHAKRRAETGVMEPRAEELGGSWLHQKLKGRPGRVSVSESSWFQISGLWNCEKGTVLF